MMLGVFVAVFLFSFLVQKNKNGENVTANEYKWDNGFLYSIFWKTADRLGISQYLD